MRHPIFFLCVLACGSDEVPETTTTNYDTATDTELAVMEGSWTTEQFSPAVDPCGLYNPADPEGYVPFSYELSQEGGNSFLLEGSEDDWTCTINGNGFTCDTPTSSQPVGYGLSADLTLAMGLSGVIMSESHINAEHNIIFECEGVDCSQVISVLGLDIPCTLRGSMQLYHTP